MVTETGFKTFEDLETYKVARAFRVHVYALARKLPDIEKYNLAGQMRRASLSLTNCIAEGHGRYHYQETIQFLRQSRGSLQELSDDLNTCLDENYAKPDEINGLKEEAHLVLLKLNAYIKYLRSCKEQDSHAHTTPI